MSKAVVTFTDHASGQKVDDVEFVLVDNPGCRAWQYAVMLNNKSRRVYASRPVNFQQTLPANIQERYELVKSTVLALSTSKFVWNHAVPDFFDQIDQEFLNVAHRHFTNCCKILWDPLNSRFIDPQLDKLLHDLNDIVHELELYVPTKVKLQYYQSGRELRLINNGQELGYDIFPFRQYHSYEHADLIMDSYILGKTIIESFACEDDPSSWDTAGHVRTNGGAFICLDQTREHIYNSPEFTAWLQNYNLTKHQTYADFPLGNFVPGHRNKIEAIYQNIDKYSAHINIEL